MFLLLKNNEAEQVGFQLHKASQLIAERCLTALIHEYTWSCTLNDTHFLLQQHINKQTLVNKIQLRYNIIWHVVSNEYIGTKQ